jgi:hypothetical protein
MDQTERSILSKPAVAYCLRSAGFREYDNGIFSKHRGVFIDLDFQELRGVDRFYHFRSSQTTQL